MHRARKQQTDCKHWTRPGDDHLLTQPRAAADAINNGPVKRDTPKRPDLRYAYLLSYADAFGHAHVPPV
jgi:hypothetical protein